MKAIAAVALTEGLDVSQIVAAGAIVSASVLLLGVTGLIDVVNRWVPKSTVRGIQLAVGLALLIKGVDMVAGSRGWLTLDGPLPAIAAAVVVLALARSRTIPAALVLVCGGFAAAVLAHPSVLSALSGGFWRPHLLAFDHASLASGALRAALPQVPLTTLNSVVAVCALSVDLFPDRPARPRPVSISVGLMNLVGAPFGAMPMCHGAGGLAGQYRFGARTSGSILFLGAVKVAVAVVFGASARGLCQAFPSGILGVMLAFSGVDLALVARDQTRRTDALVALVTAGVSLALANVAIGFAVGLLVGLALGHGARDRGAADDDA
jgi:MFS superfamily sulfate permease-like transporter